MDLGLKGKVAVITGGSDGIGRATAEVLAREGAKVLCVDHNLESAKETVEMIGVNQGMAVAFRADVTKGADLKAMGEFFAAQPPLATAHSTPASRQVCNCLNVTEGAITAQLQRCTGSDTERLQPAHPRDAICHERDAEEHEHRAPPRDAADECLSLTLMRWIALRSSR